MRSRKIHPLIVAAIAIVALLGSVQVADALGYWQTSGREMVDLDNLKSADIKGWMSLQEVSDGTHIPMAELLKVMELPADTPATTLMKDLEEIVDTETSRERIGVYLGEVVPETTEGETAATPEPTAAATPQPTLAEPAATAEPKVEASRTPAPAGQLAPADIKGSMTLQEISDGTGIPLDKLLAEAKLPADLAPTTAVKDVIGKVPDFEVQALRDAATRLLQ